MTRDELEEHIADISWRKHGNDGMEEIMALVDQYALSEYGAGWKAGYVQGGVEEIAKSQARVKRD